jgi:hypothetical protein
MCSVSPCSVSKDKGKEEEVEEPRFKLLGGVNTEVYFPFRFEHEIYPRIVPVEKSRVPQECDYCWKEEQDGEIRHSEECENRWKCESCGKMMVEGKIVHHSECRFIQGRRNSKDRMTYGVITKNRPLDHVKCRLCRSISVGGIINHEKNCRERIVCGYECRRVEQDGRIDHSPDCLGYKRGVSCDCCGTTCNGDHTMSCVEARECYSCGGRESGGRFMHTFDCENKTKCESCGILADVDSGECIIHSLGCRRDYKEYCLTCKYGDILYGVRHPKFCINYACCLTCFEPVGVDGVLKHHPLCHETKMYNREKRNTVRFKEPDLEHNNKLKVC